MKSKKYKIIIFVILIALLFLPLLQMNFNLVKTEPLKGSFSLTQKPNSISQNWFSEKYQTQYDKFYNEHLGFRNPLVRINNQLKYSLFDKINAYGLILGKDGYTFGQGYIEGAYSGQDFLGKEKADKYLNKTKDLQTKLKKEFNIDLLIIYAPSKEFIIPEYLPEKYQHIKRDTTNIDYFVQQSKKLEINHIDFNAFFKAFKDTSKYTTYYKQAEHWSYYTMCLVSDSIIKYIEKLRAIDMADVKFTNIKKSTDTKFYDYDQGDAMNILFKIPQENVVYPEVKVDTVNKIKPKVLGVADCYYSQLYESPIFDNAFYDGGDLWFYYKQSEPKNKPIVKMIDVNKREEILKQDVIIILHTNHTLQQYGYGFIDDLELLIDKDKYQQIAKKDKDYEQEILNTIKRIKNDKKWYNQVVETAKERNTSIKNMLRRSAIFVIKNRAKK